MLPNGDTAMEICFLGAIIQGVTLFLIVRQEFINNFG
jgi:hypothetical protein